MMRFLLLLLLSISINCFCQNKDASLWLSSGVKASLTEQIQLSYEMQTRFYKNATTIDSYINEVGISYEPIKNLDFSLDYRYSRKNQEYYFEGVHRLALNASYGVKLDDIGLSLKGRIRYQAPFNYLGIINDAIYPDNRNVMRFKIAAKYKPVNLKKILPFASYEFYKAINPKNIYRWIDSYRLVFGVTFNLPKRHEVEIYYLLEKENRAVPAFNHVYGIQYSYDIFKNPIIKKAE